MKERWEEECTDLRAELAALQKKLHALETKQAGATISAPTLFRRRLSKSVMVVVLPVVMLLAAGGVLYGQGAIDALFIDQQGRVGIGTTTPNATLDVAGTLNVTKKASLANTTVTGLLTTEGNVGIKTTSQGTTLDVGGLANTDKQISVQVRSGNSIKNFNSNQITFGYSNTDTYRHAIKTRHNGGAQKENAIDFYVWKYDKDKVDSAAIGGLHTMTLDGGNVGIGTTDPKNTLDVKGRAHVQSLSFTDESGAPYADNWIGMTRDVEEAKTKWLHIGGITDGGQRRIALYADTTRVSGNLQVKGALTFASQKVCSPVVGNAWRDTIIVPATWTKDTCNKYRAQVGASSYNLACIFEDSYSFGDTNGGLPSPNCDWK